MDNSQDKEDESKVGSSDIGQNNQQDTVQQELVDIVQNSSVIVGIQGLEIEQIDEAAVEQIDGAGAEQENDWESESSELSNHMSQYVDEDIPLIAQAQFQVQEEEEQKIDPSWKAQDAIKHCQHYVRYCQKLSPCCNIYYLCRLCHDENYKGIKAPGCKVEVMERQKVIKIQCKRCDHEQEPAFKCSNCQIIFGHYYCEICKFWDDDKTKNIYHCDKCNMCRRGIKEEVYHCDKCNICLQKSLLNNHKCTEQAFSSNCPVCQENLKESVKFVQQFPRCGHWIHSKCLSMSFVAGIQKCPVCNTPVQVMSQGEISFYDKIVKDSQDKLPDELKDTKIDFQCLDCNKDSKQVKFHFYLKCTHCGSYQTKQ